MQVELAQLEYALPRLTRMWTHLDHNALASPLEMLHFHSNARYKATTTLTLAARAAHLVMTTSLGPTWLKSRCQNGVRYYVDTTCAWKPEADCEPEPKPAEGAARP